MYQIIKVPDHAAHLPEQLGTKPKFWFQGENSVNYLFKEGRPNTGDDWSEKVASELCDFLGLPHAVYKLAVWRGRRGVICPSFVPEGGRLVHGNELLAEVVAEYPARQFFRVHQHTLRSVLAIIEDETVRVPIGWERLPGVLLAIDVFTGYLMLDAWIANQDRHHENWSLVVSPEPAVHLAPTYDHASSLGSNETDKNRRDRLTTRDRGRLMERYVERAQSAFFSSPSHSKPMSTLDAFRYAGSERPAAARAWLESLAKLSWQDVQMVFELIPCSLISDVAIEFALGMLDLNRQRLLALRGEFR
jgi:hypothetical protein